MYEYELPEKSPPWYAGPVLRAAAIYNLVWGAAVILFPGLIFRIAEMQPPLYPQLWQCVGMVVGVYGVGYWIAAANPYRHWPIILVGLLGKVLGPIGFVSAAMQGQLPWLWGITILFNDLIWWIPFASILYCAAKANSDSSIGRPHDLDDATHLFASQAGRSLFELSSDKPLMLVFLRHFGCTFCREALADLSTARAEIEESGLRLCLVHMSDKDVAERALNNYGLNGLHHFSDSKCEIYRAVGLDRGSSMQLFGPTVVWRALFATLRGHLIGPLQGDGFRMPGIFLVYRGEICGSYRHRLASDRPDYAELAGDFRESLERDLATS